MGKSPLLLLGSPAGAFNFGVFQFDTVIYKHAELLLELSWHAHSLWATSWMCLESEDKKSLMGPSVLEVALLLPALYQATSWHFPISYCIHRDISTLASHCGYPPFLFSTQCILCFHYRVCGEYQNIQEEIKVNYSSLWKPHWDNKFQCEPSHISSCVGGLGPQPEFLVWEAVETSYRCQEWIPWSVHWWSHLLLVLSLHSDQHEMRGSVTINPVNDARSLRPLCVPIILDLTCPSHKAKCIFKLKYNYISLSFF